MKFLWFGFGSITAVCIISLLLNVYFWQQVTKPDTKSPPSAVENQEAAKLQEILPELPQEQPKPVPTPAPTPAAAKAEAASTQNASLKVSNAYYSFHSKVFSIQFATNGIVEEPTADKIILTPAVDDLKMLRSGNNCWELTGSFESETEYQFLLKAGLKTSTGETLPKDKNFWHKIPPLPSRVYFLTSGPYYPLSPGKRGDRAKVTLPIAVSNTNAIQVTLSQTYDDNLSLRDMLSYWKWQSLQRELTKITLPVAVKCDRKEQQIDLELDKLLPAGKHGVYFLTIDASERSNSWYSDDTVEIIVSDLGLSAVLDTPGRRCQVLVRSLTDGTAVPKAAVALYSRNNQLVAQGETDDTGMAAMDYRPEYDDDNGKNAPRTVVARSADDKTYLILNPASAGPPFANDGRRVTAGLEAFVYSERGVCRPGEEIMVSAFIREQTKKATKAVPTPCQIIVTDPLGKVFSQKQLQADDFGFVTTKFQLPKSARTGEYTVKCGLDSRTVWGSSSFVVATYVPDRFKVELEVQPQIVTPREKVDLTATAAYYFGSPVPYGTSDLKVNASVAGAPRHWQGYEVGDRKTFKAGKAYQNRRGLNDGKVKMSYPGFASRQGSACSPVQLLLEATVTDEGGRGVTARERIICLPSEFFLGLQQLPADDLMRDQSKIKIKRLTWQPEDNPVVGPISLQVILNRLEWKYVHKIDNNNRQAYVWEEISTPYQEPATFVMTGQEDLLLLAQLLDGQYELIVTDKFNLRTRIVFWHWQGQSGLRNANVNVLSFTTSQEQYRPGDTAKITLNAPAPGYLHISGGELQLEQALTREVKAGSNSFDITIPNHASRGYYFVGVTLVCPDQERGSQFGLLRLPLIQEDRRLKVDIALPEKATPGETVSATVKLTGAAGKPDSGLVQLFAVDEGILALTAFHTPDIMEFFHGRQYCNFQYYDLYSQLFPEIHGSVSSVGGDAVARRRKVVGEVNFSQPAIWISPALSVPASGELTVQVPLPNHTGALRMMAVAASENLLGSGERQLIMREKISVLLTAPRAVSPGDEIVLTVTAFNHDSTAETATLQLQLPPGLTANAPLTREISLARGASQVWQIPCQANSQHGSAKIEVSLQTVDARASDTASLILRSSLPPTTRSEIKVLEPGKTFVIHNQDADWQSLEEVTLQVAASPLVGLPDALQWLHQYPYGCLEQTTSKAFPFLALDDLCQAGILGDLKKQAAIETIESSIARILTMLTPKDGFSMWPGSSWHCAEASIFAAHFLVVAHQKQLYQLDESIKIYLREYLHSVLKWSSAPRWERAHAVYVLSIAGYKDYVADALSLLESGENDLASLLAAAALIRAGHAAQGAEYMRSCLAQEVWHVSPEKIIFAHSKACRLGLAMAIIMDNMPSLTVGWKLAAELQKELRDDSSSWGTTHANAWVSYGLAKLASSAPLGNAELEINIGKEQKQKLMTDTVQELSLATTGEETMTNVGKVPCFLRMSYFGIPKKWEAQEGIMTVSRTYLDQDGQSITKIKHGQLLTAKLEISADRPVKDLIVVDLLPGGLEIEDERLVTRASAYYISPSENNPLRQAYLEKRDDRFLFFGDLTAPGTAQITYQVRAVSKGSFAIPPVTVESMYDPDTKGSSFPNTTMVVE